MMTSTRRKLARAPFLAALATTAWIGGVMHHAGVRVAQEPLPWSYDFERPVPDGRYVSAGSYGHDLNARKAIATIEQRLSETNIRNEIFTELIEIEGKRLRRVLVNPGTRIEETVKEVYASLHVVPHVLTRKDKREHFKSMDRTITGIFEAISEGAVAQIPEYVDRVLQKYATLYAPQRTQEFLDFIRSITLAESTANPNVRPSSAGAIGLMQVKPETAIAVDYRQGTLTTPPHKLTPAQRSTLLPFMRARLTDLDTNVAYGAWLAKDALDRYGWDFKKAAADYNWGCKDIHCSNIINAFEQGSYLPLETQRYVAKTEKLRGQFGRLR